VSIAMRPEKLIIFLELMAVTYEAESSLAVFFPTQFDAAL